MNKAVVLEAETQKLCEDLAKQPSPFEHPPEKGRALLERAQERPVYKHPAVISVTTVGAGQYGTVPVFLIRPEGKKEGGRVMLYLHGAGWVFGSFHTHEKLVRELAARTGALIMFPEYSRAPEAQYPVAVEQCYAVLCALTGLAAEIGWEAAPGALTVAGDGAGGNLAIAMTILARDRRGPAIDRQLLLCPVTDARGRTRSYRRFAQGYPLTRAGMRWLWDQYTRYRWDRGRSTVSPLRASPEALEGLPPAFVITAEADILRDQGGAYVKKLRRAGISAEVLCIPGAVHGFVVLHALDQTAGCRAAMDAAVAWLGCKDRA